MIRTPFLLFFLLLLLGNSRAQVSTVSLPVKPIPEPRLLNTNILNYCNSQPQYQSLSYESKMLFYYTNFSRTQPQLFWDSLVVPLLVLFPELKGKEAATTASIFQQNKSLPLFKLNTQLIACAKSHANDLAKHQALVSHQSSDGKSFADRIRLAGIRHCANENIAMANQSVLLSLVLLYLDIGLKDPGHRKALLNPVLVEMGIGSANYDNDQVVMVQDMSCSQD